MEEAQTRMHCSENQNVKIEIILVLDIDKIFVVVADSNNLNFI